MPMLTMTQRGLGATREEIRAALFSADSNMPFIPLLYDGGESGGSSGSFLDQWGVPLAAGVGGLAVGVLLAVLVKRKRGRKKGKR